MTANRAQFAESPEDDGSLRSTSSSKLLTAEEVAKITGLSVETLAQWRSQKRGLQFVKISRNFVRYWQSDLDAWLAERIVRTDDTRRNGGS
jgi:predicted DNA-binding transcriptional regulator AlpA